MLKYWTLRAGSALCAALLAHTIPAGATAQQAAQPEVAAATEPLSGTARLNAEQAAKSQREAEAYEARLRASQQAGERGQEEFTAQTEVYEENKAEAAQQAADVRLKWEADVRACKAGDKTRCGATEPVPVPQ